MLCCMLVNVGTSIEHVTQHLYEMDLPFFQDGQSRALPAYILPNP